MARKYKPRIIPEQDRRICGGICVCQLTAVLSGVALVYLTVAVYLPARRTLLSGFDPTPVTCQTVGAADAKSCSWASCGEWCLTRTSGFCPQINVTVRHNGTAMRLHNCTRVNVSECPEVDRRVLPHVNCNNGTECAHLKGLFSCALGHCTRLDKHYLCHHRPPDGPKVDADRDNAKMVGFFQCVQGKCTKITKAFTCDRLCPSIPTGGATAFVMERDAVHAAACQWAEAEGYEDPGNYTQLLRGNYSRFWAAADGDALVVSCLDVKQSSDIISGVDCVNGSLLRASDLTAQPEMNFTTFWTLVDAADRPADALQSRVPSHAALTIVPQTRLYINMDACVNTLQGECKVFYDTHGKFGDNHTAQSRFPCYYDKNATAYVVARFDLARTRRELVVALAVPATLFVVAAAALCLITRSVQVGDDARMRCRFCAASDDAQRRLHDDRDDDHPAARENECPM